MTKSIIKLRDEEIIQRFIEIGVLQAAASANGDSKNFNTLYEEQDEILSELRNRQGDKRRLLIDLYDHPNIQVRLNAAVATLALAPAKARRQLEAIRLSRQFPQAADAGMTLWNLDRGIFKPE